MKIRFNPLMLGAFIVGAIVIAIGLLLGLGPINLFHSTGHFVFYLPRSVQGINNGSAVSLDGVRIGQVEQVRIYYNRNTHKSLVGVVCRIDKDLLRDLHGREINLTDARTLTNLISDGLFVQVQTTGVIGAKYVGLGFRPSSPPITFDHLPSSPYPVVPSVPSTMSELSDNISEILSNLRQIDFRGLMQQVNGVLASAQSQINELGTNHLTDHISSAAESVGNFVNSSDLRGAVSRLRQAAANFQNLVTNINAQVVPAGTNLNATLVSAKQSVQALDDLLNLRNQLGEQTQELLEQLNQTARSIEQLSDFLARHPNALITGRTKPAESH
jgi:phospholipid/cholesterol/gamma-HCH transport system substrate-binding protein